MGAEQLFALQSKYEELCKAADDADIVSHNQHSYFAICPGRL